MDEFLHTILDEYFQAKAELADAERWVRAKEDKLRGISEGTICPHCGIDTGHNVCYCTKEE